MVRRNRLVLALAIVVSAVVVAAWFPASALLHQRAALDAASAQLSRLDRENAALQHRERQLRTMSTIGRIAEEQYGLVPLGDQAYQVLPPSGSRGAEGTLTPTESSVTSVKSRGASGALAPRASEGSKGTPGTSGGFFERVLRTLEFWR
ncbi:MAG: hypothetical protein M0Z46_23060 [Actinomycetota bacterium]|nr:hypothetical protein [Actinomycetota bacterium]